MTTPIYLDYNATTPIDPAVVDAMEPYLRDYFGNPSSDHAYGYRARAAVQTAREQLADLLGAAPAEVVFTGGGNEANNLAIKGVAYALRARGTTSSPRRWSTRPSPSHCASWSARAIR
jgi:cysteine desulfurase